MELAERLRERRREIEQATLARVYAVSDPGEVEDPEYALGLKEAVRAAIDYATAAIEAGGREPPPIPEQLLTQARIAARNGVSLDTVLRRYSVGYTLLGDFVIAESQAGNLLPGAKLQDILRITAGIFDRVVATVSSEYEKEAKSRPPTASRRRRELVEMLLAGEPVDPAELRYDLSAWHIAAIGSGPGAVEALRDLAAALDRTLLLARAGEGVVWVWWGGRGVVPAADALRVAKQSLPGEVSLALGEPGRGVGGWRLSHRQARAAMPVAQRGAEKRVRYADVALIASALCDDLLGISLQEIYLAPLDGESDGGAVLRRTLAAYFEAGHSASSAAAKLGIARQTVSAHLRAIEGKIQLPLESCAAELGLALRLREMGSLDGLTPRQPD